MASVELCPKCHASIALTSYKLSFDFARAYEIPTKSEVACIENTLRNPCAESSNLIQEIERVESMLKVLKAHRAHVDTYIRISSQYIRPSPIRRLPTEVLGAIFSSACTSFQRSEYKTPLSISLVCSKWRDYALSTPSLWTHIYIAPHLDGLDVYEYFLQRCGNIPISVKVEIPYKERRSMWDCDKDFPYEDTYEYHTELVAAISNSCTQWKVAELCMNLRDVNFLCEDIPAPQLPVLESLVLVTNGPLDSDLELDIFIHASLLTNFTILDAEGNNVDHNFYIDALPWRQLGEICIQSSDVAHTLRRLEDEIEDGCNRTLVLRPGRSEDLGCPLQFTLRISTLVFDSERWSQSLVLFFQNVTIPTLESLTMLPPDPPVSTTGHFVLTDPFSSLPEFLDRSGCTLQTLTIVMRGRYCSLKMLKIVRGRYVEDTQRFGTTPPTLAAGLITALQSMTALRALRIIEAQSGPSLLDAQLFQEMAEGQLVPALTSLELVWAEDRQPADALIPMLNSRCGQGGTGMNTLSSVVLGVRSGGDLRRDVLDCMVNLRQQGIRATLW